MSAVQNKAVFLSYASQDAEAARRICDALRAAGVEVWFDQSELCGGDAWDAKIRKQIKECALFVPIISANTQARLEGYFRLEWRLADQRSHLMAKGKPFLLPVAIDATRDAEAHVPDSFLEVQWTRLCPAARDEGGHALAEAAVAGFGVRVQTLLSGSTGHMPTTEGAAVFARGPIARPARRRWWVPAILSGVALVAIAIWQPWKKSDATSPPRTPPAATKLSAARELLEKARVLAEEGDDAKRENFFLADELVKKALALDSADGEIWAAQALVSARMWELGYLRSTAQTDALRAQAERAIALVPDSIEAGLAYAEYLAIAQTGGVKTDCIPRFQALIAKSPGDRRLYRGLAMAYANSGSLPAEGLAAADRANALPGGDPVALTDKAMYLFWAGRLAEAEATIGQSLALRPIGRARILDVLLKLCWRGDLDGAAAALDQWPAWLFAQDRGAFVGSSVWLWRGEPQKALTILRGFTREQIIDSTFTGPRAALVALALEQAGSGDAARAEWTKALAVAEAMATADDARGQAAQWRAVAFAGAGRAAEAAEAFRLLEQEANPLRRSHVYWWPVSMIEVSERALGREATMFAAFARDAAGREGRNDPFPRAALQKNPAFAAFRKDARFATLLAQSPAPALAPTATPDSKSVAVLAFHQLSADPENEYLCEAISDELCSRLGSVPGLKVAASASAFTFRAKTNLRPAEIAAQLGVAYLVNGSVQKIGKSVRVRATLIKAGDESTVWQSGNLDHEVKDVFALQDEVVGAIARNLEVQLGATGSARGSPLNTEAYRLYREGREAWKRRTSPGEAGRARGLFQQAIALDPGLGRAYAGLVDVAAFDAGQADESTYGDRNSAKLTEIAALAEKAVQLEPNSAEAHVAKGRVLWHAWLPAEAERAYRKAIELNPNYPDAHLLLARLLHAAGRMDEALAEVRRTAQLDPLTSRSFDNSSLLLGDAGRSVDALAAADQALAIQPDSIEGMSVRMRALSDLDRHEEAVGLARTLVRLQASGTAQQRGTATRGLVRVLYVLIRAKMTTEARELFSTTSWTDQSRPLALAAIGETEKALEALDPQAASLLAVTALFYRAEWDPARKDPRFVRFLQQVGWKDAHDRAQAWRAAHPPERPGTKE